LTGAFRPETGGLRGDRGRPNPLRS
jgi:hypothetical protein